MIRVPPIRWASYVFAQAPFAISHRGCQISPRDNLVLVSFEDERSGSGRGRKQNIRMACRRSSLNCLSLATSEEVAKIKTARNKKERGEKETGKRAREKRILEPFDTFNHRLFSSSFSFSFFFFARPPLRAENRALSFCGNGCSNKLLSSHSLSYFPRHFLCRAVGAYRCPLFGTST